MTFYDRNHTALPLIGSVVLSGVGSRATEGNFWEVVVRYLSGKESVIPLERGTLAPDELLLCKIDTVPGSGLVLDVAAVSQVDYKSNFLIIKAGTL